MARGHKPSLSFSTLLRLAASRPASPTPAPAPLKALGAPARAIHALFLNEAAVLSLIGASIGLAIGELGSWLIGHAYPQVAGGAPGWAIWLP